MKSICFLSFYFAFSNAESWQEPLLGAVKVSPSQLASIARHAQTRANQVSADRPHLGTQCPPCAGKDYSDPCPLGWRHDGRGMCSASSSYSGMCKHQQDFAGHLKEVVELTCDVCWPCRQDPQCPRDYSQPCPNGYSPKEIQLDEFSAAMGMSCVADINVQGQCALEANFKDENDKREFAEQCQVSWPCATSSCKPSGPCPLDWTHLDDSRCAAPAYYKVAGCDLVQDFSNMSDAAKLTHSKKCGFQWACQ